MRMRLGNRDIVIAVCRAAPAHATPNHRWVARSDKRVRERLAASNIDCSVLQGRLAFFISVFGDRLSLAMIRRSVPTDAFQRSLTQLHGVPDLPFLDPNFFKERFGVEGKAVLLTFGLLSPNKGIESVIQALPEILSKHKNVVYMVAGATHPHILRREGDRYRERLQALAKKIGVESSVIFHDRFVSPEEMVEFIGAADIYVTPYRHEAQVVSGTLAYALGAGKAIISTPYWHDSQ